MVQVSFFLSIIATFMGFVPFTYKCYQFIQRAKIAAPSDYDFPQLEEFKVSVFFFTFFLVTHMLWIKFSTKLIEPFCKIQDDIKQRDIRTRKMVLDSYSFVLYTVFTIWGYNV